MSSTQPEPTGHSANTYIYCVARPQAASTDTNATAESLALNVSGIGGKPVRAIPYSDVAAVVSDSPFDTYDVTRENLMAHEQVVENIMEHSDVLPVSFGTVADDDQAVQQLLLAGALNNIHQAFDVVHGRVELGVKVMWVQDRLFSEIAAEDETITALLNQIAGTTAEETYDQRAQLGELTSNAIEHKRDQDAAVILQALQPLAVDSRVNEIFADMMVLNASFLVDKQQVPAFQAQVDSLRQAQEGRLLFQFAGPLPPYSFVSIAVGKENQDVNVEVPG